MKKNRMLKKILGAPLLFAISISINALQAANTPGATNKTFLMPRDLGTNVARKHTTWHKTRNCHAHDKKNFGAHFEVTGFYQSSEGSKTLGKYFGTQYNPSGANNLGSVIDYFGVDAADKTMPFFPADILHDALNGFSNGANLGFQNATVNPLSDKVQFRPRREVWGVDMTYYQNLSKWAKGLYLRITSPLAWVKSGLHARSVGNNKKQFTNNTPLKTNGGSPVDYVVGTDVFPNQTATGAGAVITPTALGAAGSSAAGSFVGGTSAAAVAGKQVSVLDYLQGNVVQTIDPNKQLALKSAKVGNTSETILADVRADLGYDIISNENAHVGLSAMFVAPTSKTANGEYLFQPLAGTGHWSVGGTLDGHYSFELSDEVSLALHGAVNYQWGFEQSEQRTLGFNYKNGNRAVYGHWLLGGQAGQSALFPLANVLTREVSVCPGSKVDALTSLSLVYGNWVVDAGYNFYFRDAEDVTLKQAWVDNTYAIANFAYNSAASVTSGSIAYNGFQPQGVVPGVGGDKLPSAYAFNNFPSTVTPSATTNYTINASDLVIDACKTPSQMSHKVFGGIGYVFNSGCSPVSLSIGGSLEFANSRSTLEQWDAYAKIGVVI